MEMLQRLISERPTIAPRTLGEGESIKLSKLTESDDIDNLREDDGGVRGQKGSLDIQNCTLSDRESPASLCCPSTR